MNMYKHDDQWNCSKAVALWVLKVQTKWFDGLEQVPFTGSSRALTIELSLLNSGNLIKSVMHKKVN